MDAARVSLQSRPGLIKRRQFVESALDDRGRESNAAALRRRHSSAATNNIASSRTESGILCLYLL